MDSGLKKQNHPQKILLLTAAIFGFSFFYAFIRYNLFGGIPFSDIPLFILNKAVSFSGTIFLLQAVLLQSKQKSEAAYFFQVFDFLILLHILFSFTILSPQYFPKLFNEQKLSVLAALALGFGALAFAYLKSNFFKKNRALVLVFVALHLLFLGGKGWTTPANWYAYMPPITLLSFLVITATLFLYLKNRKRKKSNLFPEQKQ